MIKWEEFFKELIKGFGYVGYVIFKPMVGVMWFVFAYLILKMQIELMNFGLTTFNISTFGLITFIFFIYGGQAYFNHEELQKLTKGETK